MAAASWKSPLRPTTPASSLTIRDHGPGLPESSREEIFEPYVRLAHGRETNRDGSGLGLGIARGILREHGGDVRLDNHPKAAWWPPCACPRARRRRPEPARLGQGGWRARRPSWGWRGARDV